MIRSSHTRIPSHGVTVGATLPSGKSSYSYPRLPRDGVTATSASVEARVTVERSVAGTMPTASAPASDGVVEVTFTVLDKAGNPVATQKTSGKKLPANISASLQLKGDVQLWSVARPYVRL